MPLVAFQCPDGDIVSVEQCLSHCDHRCLTLPTLKLISEERVWNGQPSTTQLLNGTMQEFLKLTRDFFIEPQSRAFALLGTGHHDMLSTEAKEMGLLSEVALSPDGRDIFDLLEPESDGTWLLTDYKTWGSYRVSRALGLVEHKAPDPTGAKYKISGKWGKAGTSKMISIFSVNPNNVDLWNEEMQLNNYRVKLEDRGLNIKAMQLQVTVRDGNTQIATSRGIDFNIRLIPIKRLEDDYVKQYFDRKARALLLALEIYQEDKTFLPQPCDNRECWDGRRCQGYCEVAMYCPKGMLYQGGK